MAHSSTVCCSPAEPNNLVVEPWLGCKGDQKLGAVRVRAVVGHGQNPGLVKLDGKRFVAEHISVDRTAAIPCAGRDVPSLHPRASHHAVERAALVA